MNGSMCLKLASSFFNEAGRAAHERLNQADFSKVLRQRPHLVLSFHEKQCKAADKQVQHHSSKGLSKAGRPVQSCLSCLRSLRKTLRSWLVNCWKS